MFVLERLLNYLFDIKYFVYRSIGQDKSMTSSYPAFRKCYVLKSSVSLQFNSAKISSHFSIEQLTVSFCTWLTNGSSCSIPFLNRHVFFGSFCNGAVRIYPVYACVEQ